MFTPFSIWWRTRTSLLADYLFGKTECSRELVEGPTTVLVFMPERGYEGIAKLTKVTWKRPRLLWKSQQLFRAYIDNTEDPIPVPGKGAKNETSACAFTVSGVCTVADAAKEVSKRMLRRRGQSWRPERNHQPRRTA